MTTVLDIVIGCENWLGWVPPVKPGRNIHRTRAVEVAKLTRAMAKEPNRITIANLELALEYSRRKRMGVGNPYGLIARIDVALDRARDDSQLSDLGAEVQAAVNHELAQDRPDVGEWIARLTRAQGGYRRDVLDEWKDAGRG